MGKDEKSETGWSMAQHSRRGLVDRVGNPGLERLVVPGDFGVVAISMILEAAMMKFVPEAFEEEQPETPSTTPAAPPSATVQSPEHHRIVTYSLPKVRRPGTRPRSEWTSPRSADCSFCALICLYERANLRPEKALFIIPMTEVSWERHTILQMFHYASGVMV